MSKCDYLDCNEPAEYDLCVEVLSRIGLRTACKRHADAIRAIAGLTVLRECPVQRMCVYESPPPTTARIESPVRPKRKEPRVKINTNVLAKNVFSQMSSYMARLANAEIVYTREVLTCCDIVENICQQIKKDLIVNENTVPIDLSLDE